MTSMTPEEFRASVKEYFDEYSGKPVYALDEAGRIFRDRNGQPFLESKRYPTLSGLALHLDLDDHMELLRLRSDPVLGKEATRAVLRVQTAYEMMIQDPDSKPTAVIAALKTLFWSEEDVKKAGKTKEAPKLRISFVGGKKAAQDVESESGT